MPYAMFIFSGALLGLGRLIVIVWPMVKEAI